MSGFVKLPRSLLDHHAFRNQSEAMAFAWLVARAAWRDVDVTYKGRAISLKRGQVALSIRDFASHWGCDKGWVERLMKRLKSTTLVKTDDETGVLVISICDYDAFQGVEAERETGREHNERRTQDTEQRREEGEELSQKASPSSRGAREPKAKPQRLPDDWKPARLAEDTVAREVIDRRGVEWARTALERFRNWAANADDRVGRKLDWQKAWANWVIEQDERYGQNHRSQGAIQSGRHPTVSGQQPDLHHPLVRAAARVGNDAG